MIFILILNNTYLVCLWKNNPNAYTEWLYILYAYISYALFLSIFGSFFWDALRAVGTPMACCWGSMHCGALAKCYGNWSGRHGRCLGSWGWVGCWVVGWSISGPSHAQLPRWIPWFGFCGMFQGYVGEFLAWSKDPKVKTTKTQVVISCDIELCQLAWDKQIYEISYDSI